MTTGPQRWAGAAVGALIVLASTAGAAWAEDRRVRIVNRTGVTMTEFYASRVSTEDWEEDILGVDVLENGQSATVNIDDGTGACRFDFKAVFDDGDVVEREDINVCETETYVYE
jgi:hypothetical protein